MAAAPDPSVRPLQTSQIEQYICSEEKDLPSGLDHKKPSYHDVLPPEIQAALNQEHLFDPDETAGGAP
jgi:hypothetical protein